LNSALFFAFNPSPCRSFLPINRHVPLPKWKIWKVVSYSVHCLHIFCFPSLISTLWFMCFNFAQQFKLLFSLSTFSVLVISILNYSTAQKQPFLVLKFGWKFHCPNNNSIEMVNVLVYSVIHMRLVLVFFVTLFDGLKYDCYFYEAIMTYVSYCKTII